MANDQVARQAGMDSVAKESGRQKMRRLQSVRSGLFFAACLPNIQIFGGEIVKNYPRRGHFSLRRLLPPRLLARPNKRLVPPRRYTPDSFIEIGINKNST